MWQVVHADSSRLVGTACVHIVARGDTLKSAILHSVFSWMRVVFGPLKCWFWATIEGNVGVPV
jgi:hypothetical protein